MNLQKRILKLTTLILFIYCLINSSLFAQKLDDFQSVKSSPLIQNSVKDEFQFNGYTNYWHDTYDKWIRYGNLFKMSVPDVESFIAQSRIDIAEDMGVPGLSLQEGFINGLISDSFSLLDQPSVQQIEQAISKGNVLVMLDPESEAGKRLSGKYAGNAPLKETIKSHQLFARDLVIVNAFFLQKDKRKLFVISSNNSEYRKKVKGLVDNTIKVVKEYDLHRGWFGASTLLKAVTCSPGHPLDVISKGMNEGNDWFVFSGYMEFLTKKELEDWVAKVDLPVVTDVGSSPIYGLQNYDSLQIQSMWGNESWIKFARERGGYVFRQVNDEEADKYHYDGFMASEGNKKQIDNEDVPFITNTGNLERGAVPSMMLFVKKGQKFTREVMWQAIMDRREVAVLEQGKMMGPAFYRNSLGMLALDREFLEEYYGDKVNIHAVMDGYQLKITFTNTYSHAVTGKLSLGLPTELKVKGDISQKIELPARGTRTVTMMLQPLADAMAKANPIAVHYNWGTSKKSTLANFELPPAISVNNLLYGHSPTINYPVTIHNFTGNASFPVKVEVMEKGKSKSVFTATQTCSTETATYKDMNFDLKVPEGSYDVKVTAMGVENLSQLGVGKASGAPILYAIDLNNDGVNEYRMENDSVQVTLLATGARVIEYIVKSKDDNLFFKLWPDKPKGDRRPFRDRGFYAYGGFEDFLGQASIETHKVYDAQITKKEGDYVQVKMTADYFGNLIEKTFTLYGNSPLLEVRFALKFINPELNVFGPQPILELGKKHWTEDVFTVPTKDGLREYRMMPEKYYGRAIFQKEGWNSGYDTKENISFIGAYPVSQPYFLHMWMNHPVNNDAQYYYTEFQLWIPIFQKSTMYYTYYMWGAAGPYENGLKELRDRNLISVQ